MIVAGIITGTIKTILGLTFIAGIVVASLIYAIIRKNRG